MTFLDESSEAQASRPLRVGWIGSPSEGGGVGGFCLQLLKTLNSSAVDLTVISICEPSEFERLFENEPTVPRHIPIPLRWSWNRWYSRNHLTVFLSSFWARRRAYSAILKALLEEHQKKPFDVVVQFSQSEIFEGERLLNSLPPFVLFPCVHSAGELRWHRSEAKLALKSESRWKHWCVRAVLSHRSKIQKRTYNRVAGVIGMSHRFNELVREDYGVDARDQAVVYQPLPSTHHVALHSDRNPPGKVRAIFVGRISVRKGIEMLVELSHRMDDLAHQLEIVIVGDRSFWSDYTGLLKDLNPKIARVLGALPHPQVLEEMSRSQILLVPSHYEPGGIVVAEGLASGCVVIASDEVGSAEVIGEPVCHKYPHADIRALERVFREVIADIPKRAAVLEELAVSTAQNVFAHEITQTHLLIALRNVASHRRMGEQLLEQSDFSDKSEALLSDATFPKS